MNRRSNNLSPFDPASERNNPLTNPKEKGFTLLELVVVIIIIGVLATLGFTQYSLVIEKGRTSEAIQRIGTMRQLAYDYYLKNGSLANIAYADIGAGISCTTTHFFQYWMYNNGTDIYLQAYRCTGGGKTPNVSREYNYYQRFYPSTGQSDWHCQYTDDSSACFGLAP